MRADNRNGVSSGAAFPGALGDVAKSAAGIHRDSAGPAPSHSCVVLGTRVCLDFFSDDIL
jgi:hypothetical protein